MQWVDGSPTDFVSWEDNYPPVNHRECVGARPGGGWRDVHCQSDRRLDIVCQIDLQPHLNNYYPVLLLLSSGLAITLLISTIMIVKLSLGTPLSLRGFSPPSSQK